MVKVFEKKKRVQGSFLPGSIQWIFTDPHAVPQFAQDWIQANAAISGIQPV
jgi:hypothetical protein